MLETIFLVLLVIVLIVLWYGYNFENRIRYMHIPGPKTQWMLGNIKGLQSKGFRQSHRVMQEWMMMYGDIYRYFIGRVAYIVVSDPNMVQMVTSRRFVHFHDRGEPVIGLAVGKLKEFLERQLLFIRGKEWVGLRSTCEPLFQPSMLKKFGPTMQDSVSMFMKKLSKQVDENDSVEMYGFVAPLTLDVIGKTAFGIDFGTLEQGSESPIVRAAQYTFKPYAGMPPLVGLLSHIFPSLKMLVFRTGKLIWSERVSKVHDALYYMWGCSSGLMTNVCQQQGTGKTIEKAIQGRQAYDDSFDTYSKISPAEGSVVHMLMNARNKLTGEPVRQLDIAASMYTMIAAGYETTATVISYTMYILSQYQDLQEKVYQEISTIDVEVEKTYEDLSRRAPFLLACIYETMRMYPPVTGIIALKRDAGKDAMIGSIPIPEGAKVQFNIFAMHHDERWHPDPEEFRPERFLESSPMHEKYKPRHPYSYIPFGAGSHKCIGYKFALQEALLCTISMLQGYKFEIDTSKHTGELVLWSSLTLTPSDGIWLRAKPRRQD